MNNLTQNQQSAKQSFLDAQQARTLEHYKTISNDERSATIRHIDSFLEVISPNEKNFWLNFRQKLERLNEQTA